jgi:hypothetical protein
MKSFEGGSMTLAARAIKNDTAELHNVYWTFDPYGAVIGGYLVMPSGKNPYI